MCQLLPDPSRAPANSKKAALAWACWTGALIGASKLGEATAVGIRNGLQESVSASGTHAVDRIRVQPGEQAP